MPVKVKPLEWVQEKSWGHDVWIAGGYQITRMSDTSFYIGSYITPSFGSLAEAKRHAQSLHEKIVLSYIEVTA